MKSSAVSVSSFPGLARRDAAPRRPSGLPVVNEKSADHRDVANMSPRANPALLEVTGRRMIVFNLNILWFLLVAVNSSFQSLYCQMLPPNVVRRK